MSWAFPTARSISDAKNWLNTAPNLLDQDFTATRPDEKWTGDITAVCTYEGWLYLAVVQDLFSRRVIEWAMAAIQDETLIETALRMALLGRHPAARLLCAFGSGIAIYQ